MASKAFEQAKGIAGEPCRSLLLKVSGRIRYPSTTMQGISILHSATVHGIMEFWLSSLSTFTTRLIW